MYILSVYPIVKGGAKESLSYFFSRKVPVGSIISVPLRKKIVPALVGEVEQLNDARARIRTGEFALKKISSSKFKTIFLPEFLYTVKRLADYYAVHEGAILFSTIPKMILNSTDKLPAIEYDVRNKSSQIKNEKLILQAHSTDRLEQYKNLVREELARNHSVILIAPTIQNAEHIYEALQRGIGRYAFLLHSSLSKSELLKRFNGAVASTHPVLIVATGSFLSLPRSDIGLIIVEREASTTYKMQTRPYIDLRSVAEHLASELGARLLFADLPLRISTIHRFLSKELDELSPLKTRLAFQAKVVGTDMRLEDKKPRMMIRTKKPFLVLSEQVISALRETFENEKLSFVYTARRGLTPLTACRDCGSTVLCNSCSSSAILHKGRESTQNIFVCHSCGAIRSAHERCKYCSSWRLESTGVGAELVEETIREMLPSVPLFVLSRDNVSSHSVAKKTTNKFYDSRNGILLGTEMALAYLTRSVETSAIVSLDALLAIPEWNSYERVHSIVLRIRERTLHTLYIQSRRSDEKIFSFIESGMIRDFYKEELTERERFEYPPFATFIKLSVYGSRVKVENDMRELERILHPHILSGVSHTAHVIRGKYVQHGFLRLPAGAWPEKPQLPIGNTSTENMVVARNTPTLLDKIRALPPSIIVTIDPESVL
jgi:primosomal protein N' (replication factor Y) (superfamily II helicase)